VAAPVAMEIIDNYFETVVPPEDRSPPRLAHHAGRGSSREDSRLPSAIGEARPESSPVPAAPPLPAKSDPALPPDSVNKEGR